MDELSKRIIDWALRRGRWPWLLLFPGIPAWFWFTSRFLEVSFARTLGRPLFLVGAAAAFFFAPLLYFFKTRPKALPLPSDKLAVAIAEFTPVSPAAADEARNIASRIGEALEQKEKQGVPLVIRREQRRVTGADETQRRLDAVKLATCREVGAQAVIWGEVRKDGAELYVNPRLSIARPLRGAPIGERTLPTFKSAEPNQIPFKERLSRDIADVVTLVYALALRKADNLNDAIAGLERVESPEGHFYKALSLYERAQHAAKPQPDLRAAVAAYRATLQACTKAAAPELWAATQNNLGNALRGLALRAAGPGRTRLLEDALACFDNALSVYDAIHFPELHARVAASRSRTAELLGPGRPDEPGNR